MTEPKAARGRGRPRTGEEPDPAELLQGALDAFAEKGYDGTSVRELARRLGVSHALLTARFCSKEGLWFAAVKHAAADGERTWRGIDESDEPDDLEALRRGIVQQVLVCAAQPQLGRIMNHEGATDSPRLRFVVEQFVNPLRPAVERLLARLVDAGRIRPVPYATLHYLVVQGGGAMFANPVEAALLGAPDPSDAQAVRAHAEVVAGVIVAGLATTGPGHGAQPPAPAGAAEQPV